MGTLGGLCQVAPAGDAPHDPTIDIIAIHGLETESPRTWEFKRKGGGGVVNWLSDRDMLPEALPKARIFTYDWDANCFADAPVQTLLGHADTLLGLIAEGRGSRTRPIIFIASCFGGLILAEAINRAAQEGSRYRHILLSTVGILFLATPFHGSDAAKQARWHVVVAGIMGEQASDQLIQDLEQKHEFVRQRVQRFTEIANSEAVRLPMSCFFETKKTEMLRRVVSPSWARKLATGVTHKILVTESSACLHGFSRQGLAATHSYMNKFLGPECPNFKLVKDAVRQFAGNASAVLARRTDSNCPKVCRVIPFPRNEDSVNRAHIFARLDTLLPSTSEYQSVALCGLGGSGKTQVALEYAYRRCRNDPAYSIFWVHADNKTTFTQDYTAIARKLGLGKLDGEKLLMAVCERIASEPSWLLVLDNADDISLFGVGQTPHTTSQGQTEEPTSLYDYIPRGGTGTVLWTSRDGRIVGTLVGPRRGIHVGQMSSDEAKELLETSRNEKISSEEAADAEKLLEELQWLPLAIAQAGAYLRRTSTPIRQYLSKLAEGKERWRVLKTTEFDRHRRRDVPNSVLETWSISIERIRLDNEMAYRILYTLAYVNNQDIPFEIITAAGLHGGEEETGGSGENKERVVEAVTRLKEFSFLGLRKGGRDTRSYEMHKLVQEATRYGLSVRNREDELYFSSAALNIMAKLFPERKREAWAECERYIAHAVQVGEWAEICEKEIEVSCLLWRVSDYLYDRGRWREKEPVVERVYTLRREVLGEKHPDTIRSMAELATTYYGQGRYAEAEPMKIKALELRREVLGEKHPDTIWSMAELAATYYGQGRYAEAEPMKIKALELRREVLGEKHPDTIWSMAELATTYHTQGRYAEAEPMKIKALELRREVLGEKHPDTIRSMAELTVTYHAQGRYAEDERISIEVLELRREVLGEKHPDTIQGMASLAATYHTQGRYAEAEPMKIKALELRREVLGEKHPDSLQAMNDLAITWISRGRRDDAIVLLDECLRLRRTVLGPGHPFTKQSAQTLDRWKTG